MSPSLTETSGANTRTTIHAYDSAGRLKSTTITSSVGSALPTVNYEYNTETGALSTQSTTKEGKTEKLASAYNTLGQLTSYTDAAENRTTYEYETQGDARLTKVTNGKGTESYAYSHGAVTELVNEYGTSKFALHIDIRGRKGKY